LELFKPSSEQAKEALPFDFTSLKRSLPLGLRAGDYIIELAVGSIDNKEAINIKERNIRGGCCPGKQRCS
jgi:hypothetical protein